MFLGGRGRNFLICLHCCDWCRSFFPYSLSPIPRCQTSNAFRRRSDGDMSASTGCGNIWRSGKDKTPPCFWTYWNSWATGPYKAWRNLELLPCQVWPLTSCQKGLRGNGPRTSKRARKTPGDHRMFGHVMPPWDDSRSIEIYCSGTALCFNML